MMHLGVFFIDLSTLYMFWALNYSKLEMCGLTIILWQHCFLSRNNVIKLLIEWRNMPVAAYGILIVKGFSLQKLSYFRMERSSDISKAGTARSSLCVPVFQGWQALFAEAWSFLWMGNWWLLAMLAPFTPACLLPTDPHLMVMFPTGSWEVIDLGSSWFLPWSSVKRSPITSLCTLIPNIGLSSGWKQDTGQWGTQSNFHLVNFHKFLRGGQEEDICIS